VHTNPGLALAYFARLSEEGRRDAAESLVPAWLATDEEAALRWCTAERDTAHGDAAVAALIGAAASRSPDQLEAVIARLALSPADFAGLGVDIRNLEPDAALALLPHLPERSRREAVAQIVHDELQRDPELALKLARDTLPVDVANNVVEFAWQSWLESDAKAAVAWAETLDDPALKTGLLSHRTDPLLEMDPSAFLRNARATGTQSIPPEQIVRAIDEISNLDPAAAAGWIAAMPEVVPARTIREVTFAWMERDEAATRSWIDSITSGSVRDTALAGAIGYWISRGQTEQATTAISAMTDPRRQTVIRWAMLERLHYRDPEAARQWLDAQPLSADVKQTWSAILDASVE